jgi:hypothetical protein
MAVKSLHQFFYYHSKYLNSMKYREISMGPSIHIIQCKSSERCLEERTISGLPKGKKREFNWQCLCIHKFLRKEKEEFMQVHDQYSTSLQETIINHLFQAVVVSALTHEEVE